MNKSQEMTVFSRKSGCSKCYQEVGILVGGAGCAVLQRECYHILCYIYVTEHAKRAQLTFKIILSFSAKLRLRSILGKTFLAAIQYLQQFTYLRIKF